jgi:hypothetical protein
LTLYWADKGEINENNWLDVVNVDRNQNKNGQKCSLLVGPDILNKPRYQLPLMAFLQILLTFLNPILNQFDQTNVFALMQKFDPAHIKQSIKSENHWKDYINFFF